MQDNHQEGQDTTGVGPCAKVQHVQGQQGGV